MQQTNFKNKSLNVRVSEGIYQEILKLAESKYMTIPDYVRFLIQQQIDADK
jgi:hypothetical protein